MGARTRRDAAGRTAFRPTRRAGRIAGMAGAALSSAQRRKSLSLYDQLRARAEAGRPVRVGLIGAGKFGSMFLAQARRTPGLQVLGIADLAPAKARAALARVGWPPEAYAARSFAEAAASGATYIGDDAQVLIRADGLDVLVEATGDPGAGLRHAALALDHGRHVVMVNVEADALAGPVLAARARAAG